MYDMRERAERRCGDRHHRYRHQLGNMGCNFFVILGWGATPDRKTIDGTDLYLGTHGMPFFNCVILGWGATPDRKTIGLYLSK